MVAAAAASGLSGRPDAGTVSRPTALGGRPLTRGLLWEVDKRAIVHNVGVARARLPRGTTFFAVVKANAYGFGIEGVVPALAPQVDGFALASLEDARSVRRMCPYHRILVYPCPLSDLGAIDGLTLTAWDPGSLRLLLERRPPQMAVKVDVGFGRLGFRPEEAPLAVSALGASGVRCAGIYTHLSFPAGEESRTRHEFQVFRAVIKEIRSAGVETGFAMAAATATVLQYPEMALDAANCGHLLYGFPLPEALRESSGLHQATMALSAEILQVKKFQEGERVGYGTGIVARRDTLAAVVAAGWCDGYPAFGQAEGGAVVSGRFAPLLYSPTVEFCVLDVTGIGCEPGDRVWFVGGPGLDPIPWDAAARWAGKSEMQLSVGLRGLRTYPESANAANDDRAAPVTRARTLP